MSLDRWLVLLVLLWCLFVADVGLSSLVLALVLTVATISVLREPLSLRADVRRARAACGLAWSVAADLVASCVQVARGVLRGPRAAERAALVRVPLVLRDPGGRTLLANCVTLTPGTLSVDMENDVLLVHALDASDPEAVRRHIQINLENPIRQLYGEEVLT